jgi:hypothetical protein
MQNDSSIHYDTPPYENISLSKRQRDRETEKYKRGDKGAEKQTDIDTKT